MRASPKLYLDVCCLNRPFDDQNQDRIRIESEAVRMLFKHHRLRRLQILVSQAILEEINQTPNDDRKQKVLSLIHDIRPSVLDFKKMALRSSVIRKFGFSLFDALHVASAELSGADFLLTTDDRFLKTARKVASQIAIRIDNPAPFAYNLLGL